MSQAEEDLSEQTRLAAEEFVSLATRLACTLDYGTDDVDATVIKLVQGKAGYVAPQRELIEKVAQELRKIALKMGRLTLRMMHISFIEELKKRGIEGNGLS